MNDVWYRWWQCEHCGGRMLTVPGLSGHWLMSEGRACAARRRHGYGGLLDPWPLR